MASPYFSLMNSGVFKGGGFGGGGFTGGNMTRGMGVAPPTGPMVGGPVTKRPRRPPRRMPIEGGGPTGVMPPPEMPSPGMPTREIPMRRGDRGFGRGLEVGRPGGVPELPTNGDMSTGMPGGSMTDPNIFGRISRGDLGMTGGNMSTGGPYSGSMPTDGSQAGTVAPSPVMPPPVGPQTRLQRRIGAFGGGFRGQGVF